MGNTLKVLLVEDSQLDAELALRELKRAGLDPEGRVVQTEPEFLRALEEFGPEVVLSDFSMPQFDGMRALRLLREARPDTPLIFVSGTIGEEHAIRALKDGATDYVLKTNLIRLPAAVERALHDVAVLAERRRVEKEARQFRHAIDASVDSIYITDIDAMRFVYVNDTACHRLGYSREQLLAMGPQDVLKAGRDTLRREYEEVIAADEAGVRTQHRFVGRDGAEGWTEIHRRALRTGDGWLIVTIGRDVSERKSAEEELRRFRLALDNSPDIILIIDRATMRHVDVNDTACELLGYTREELLRMGPADTLPVSREALEREYDRLIASGGESGGMHSYYRCKDGSRLPFESTRRVLRSGDRWLVVAISRDIRQRLAAESTLREEQEKTKRLTRVHAVLSGINAAIVRIRDRDELLREACRVAIDAGQFRAAWIGLANPAAGRVDVVASQGLDAEYLAVMPLKLGEAVSEEPALVARALQERRPVLRNDIATDPRPALRAKAAARRMHSLAMLPLVVSGKAIGVLALYAAEIGFFDADELKLLQELAGDISFALEHIEKSERADYLAYYDELTGLANRRLFLERLERAAHSAGHAQQKLAVSLFDVERLRTVNVSLGRQAGDALLRGVAERLARRAEQAELGRISADHFAVLLHDVKGRSEVARRVAQLWHASFDLPYRIEDRDLNMSARAGIALFPNDAAEAESLLRGAEAALRKAKAGGEHYVFFERVLTERTAERLTLESELRQALARREFVLHYQPKVDLESGQIVGAEALIRWQSPVRGLVAPALFIR
ncbi:MAG TPA: PAS domain S-box protein, partial [Burkholderiales bacterium]|nr:PAS domain S-box protein [Burkholderiales bacterium]